MGRDEDKQDSPNPNPADLETRVVPDGESADSSGDSGSLSRESIAGAETVLDAERNRTDVVANRPAAQSDKTRVLNAPDDKTSPPPIAEPAPATPQTIAETAPARPLPPVPDLAERGLTPGSVLFGEYEIVNVLGVGGMGEVYRARHRRLDEYRAIKVMHAELAKKKTASEFFYREAKALLAVRHPAVVHCHDLLSDDSGRVYLVMEMIEGIPLSKKMNDGPLSADEVAILGARVSHGLSAAHRKGVIHRDVSPDNIVLPNGRVQDAKLIDFGIAKILEEGEGTIVDGFKGKLSYASPEQLGFFSGQIDGRSDFYSLGLVLAAAALGRPMGMGTTVMEAVDARRGFETLPDEIPVGLRSAIQPLLALDPQDRPQHVDRLFVVPGVEATEPGGYSNRNANYGSSPAPVKKKPLGLFAGSALAGVLALAGGGYWISTSGDAAVPGNEVVENVTPKPETPEPVKIPEAPTPIEPIAAVVGPPVEGVEPEPAVVKVPAKPRVKRLSASDRIKIIGLVNNAKLALSENRLMTPAGDNAYDRYRRVLELDPGNKQAKTGLRTIADRYLSLAEAARSAGNGAQAKEYLSKARKADPNHPKLAAAEARLAG